MGPLGKAVGRIRLRQANSDARAAAESDIFSFECIASSDALDSHSSRFHETSLNNFVADVNGARQLPFLDSHLQDGMDRVLGRVDSARLEEKQVIAEVSMLRDTDATPDPLRVDEHIRRIERGFFNEVSVGYSGGRDECDLCGLDVWRMTGDDMCPHWPGEEYNGEVATYTIYDARLRELSLVSRGSNPEALVLNRRSDEALVLLKSSAEGTAVVPARGPAPRATKSLLEQDGERYREQLLSALVREGVRALGARFDEKVWRERFSGLDSVAIQEQIALFKQASEGLFPVGRQTIDSTVPGVARREERLELPAYLFR